jgi:hypothetical protein
MKRMTLALVLIVCLAVGANAHQGMLALLADTGNHACSVTLGIGETVGLYLMYVRGSGPYMGPAYEFKLLRSSRGLGLLDPTWPSEIVLTIGSVATGISLTSTTCFPFEDYVALGTIPIMNVSDPDTFTVQVVADPGQVPQHEIVITKCDPGRSIYIVAGGTFVFNTGCNSPEDPFGVLATRESSWGAIKELSK